MTTTTRTRTELWAPISLIASLTVWSLAPIAGAVPFAHQFISSYEDSNSCLGCHQSHADAVTDVMATIHWTWDHQDAGSGQSLGKKNVINNYCVAVPSNEPRCTSCHIGVGWRDMRVEPPEAAQVDCLVCHDSTGSYKKDPTKAGAPVAGLDLVAIAQSADMPTRQNCGACHFFGGGDDAVKHGDLDSTMTNPLRSVDVHMGTDGANFSCTNCHVDDSAANKHEMVGTRYPTDTPDHLLCQSCHTVDPDPFKGKPDNPHDSFWLNGHADRVACQTCHIPAFARGGKATKMTWDWTTAGDRMPDGSDRVIKDADGNVVYHSKKGTFTWQKDVIPEYRWFNGQVSFATLDDAVLPGQVVSMNRLHGDKDDPNARLFPVKRFTGRQPYDAGSGNLAIPHLFPYNQTDATAYWKSYDWGVALAEGMNFVGRGFSGTVGTIETEMFWIQNHMVAPKEDALHCADCHSPNSRINFAELGYDPIRAAALQNRYPLDVVTVATAEPGGAGVELVWTSSPDFDYQVQSSTDMENWTDEPGGSFSGGAAPEEFTFTDAAPGDVTKLYRVVRRHQ